MEAVETAIIWEHPEFGVLIDAGIGIRTIKEVLKDKAIDFSKIVAVLITHDHADHTRL